MACCENPYCNPHRYDPPTCRGGSWNADGSVHTAPAPPPAPKPTVTTTVEVYALHYTNRAVAPELVTLPAGSVVEIRDVSWDSDEGTTYDVSTMVGRFRAFAELSPDALNLPHRCTACEAADRPGSLAERDRLLTLCRNGRSQAEQYAADRRR